MLALVAVVAFVAASLAPPADGRLTGTVFSRAGDPIAGATVSIDGTALGTQTDAAGAFVLDEVPDGEVAVRVTAVGFAPLVQRGVAVAEGRPTDLRLTLEPATEQDVVADEPLEMDLEEGMIGAPPPPSPADPSARSRDASGVAAGLSAAPSAESSATGRRADAPRDRGDRPIRQQPGLLTAGDVDDGLNWDAYLGYVQRALRGQDRSRRGQGNLPDLHLDDRLTLRVVDRAGQPVAGARVRIEATGGDRARRLLTESGTDGRLALFPRYDFGPGVRSLRVVASSNRASRSLTVTNLRGDRDLSIELPLRIAPRPRALDLAFVIDATGSMGDELRYLTDEFESIVERVERNHPGVDLRFGLVAYRDQGDAFVVRRHDFTSSVQEMQRRLASLRAAGGGDYPEAMDEALDAALDLDWRTGTAARVMLLVADAPPHDARIGATMDAVREARARGLRIYPLAASGVADEAEYVMRAAAVLTQGRHLFLTDDSGVGRAHAEPKIPCYSVTALNSLLVRVVASELEGRRVEPSPHEILREVGSPRAGVCQSEPVTQREVVMPTRRTSELGYD